MSYDYINSLAILNYLIDSQAYEPAQSLKCYVKSKLNPGEIVDFPEKIIWPKAKSVDPYKQITKKAFNLHGLIIQTRIMVDKGMWEYKVKFEVANYEFDKKNPVVKSTTVTQNPCNDFCESLKSLVLKDINHTFLAIVWNKSFQVSFVSTKISSLLEDGIKHLFGRFILLRQMCDSLFDVLLRNNPRPSTMLTPEIGCEILHIYFLCETWIDLKDEYLTLLEISNEEKYKDEHIINFRNKAISSIPDFDIQELRARSYAALAFSHFKSRTAFEKNRDEYIQELMRVEHMAEKAINELQGATIYLWWTDTYLNEDVLNKLRKDVKIDYALLDLEKLTKSATKTAEPILRVLETWSKLLYAHAANDDPLFYWKKMKIQLKYLSKFNLSASERNQLLSIMARYVSVLLFNAEDGIPLKKEYDLPILMKIITKQLSPFFDLDKAEICKLTISVLNLMKYSPRLFNQMPFFLKRVYKGLDCTKLPVIFEIFHNNIQKFTGNLESDFHMKLCNKFEKICFEQNSEKLLKIIYRWNYGLMNGKTCKCTAKFPSNILTLPNSPEKLDRFLKFSDQTDDQEQFGFNSPQMYQDKKMYNMLRELVEKEPKLFIDCPKHGNFKKMLESSDIVTNLNCCNPIKRAIAAETFKRLACYKCDFKAKLDAKKRFDNLKEGKNFIINAIELNPTDPEL